jgi:hypothetical protein
MHVQYPSRPSSRIGQSNSNFFISCELELCNLQFLELQQIWDIWRKVELCKIVAQDWCMAWLWIAQKGKCATSLKVTEFLNWIFDVTLFNLLDLHYFFGRLHCVLIECHFLLNFEVTHIDKKIYASTFRCLFEFGSVGMNTRVPQYMDHYPCF